MDFIEKLFHIAPDHGNGMLEVFVISAILAYAAWRTVATIRISRNSTPWKRLNEAPGNAAVIDLKH